MIFGILKYMIYRNQIFKYLEYPLFKKVKKNQKDTYLKTKNVFFLDFNYLRKTSRNGITKFPENESFLRPILKHLYFHYSHILCPQTSNDILSMMKLKFKKGPIFDQKSSIIENSKSRFYQVKTVSLPWFFDHFLTPKTRFNQ